MAFIPLQSYVPALIPLMKKSLAIKSLLYSVMDSFIPLSAAIDIHLICLSRESLCLLCFKADDHHEEASLFVITEEETANAQTVNFHVPRRRYILLFLKADAHLSHLEKNPAYYAMQEDDYFLYCSSYIADSVTTIRTRPRAYLRGKETKSYVHVSSVVLTSLL